jgi:hypothetical protein
MAIAVPVISIGNELGIELPAEVIARMGLNEKSTVYVYSRGDELQVSTSATPPDGWVALPSATTESRDEDESR